MADKLFFYRFIDMTKFRLNIILILFSFLLSEEKKWTTNPFDLGWNKFTRSTMFREPITFTPFEIRTGYFHYGGADYWDELSLSSTSLGAHPLELDSSQAIYDGLYDIEDRNGIFLELDILKTNLLLKIIPQNFIDVQFGLGYRFSYMLSSPYVPSDIDYSNDWEWHRYQFNPKIHDYNINTTLSWQPSTSFMGYLYHSIGYSIMTLYTTDADNSEYLKGTGISETFAFGVKYLIPQKNINKRYNFFYGLEFKLNRTYTDNLEDPDDISPIIGMDMRGVGLYLSFGTMYGGRKTIGDEAFGDLLGDDYRSAIPKFKEYIDKYPQNGRIEKAKNLLEFCEDQLPYQNFNEAVIALKNNSVDEALRLFNDSYLYADDELKFEIDFRKDTFAKHILDSLDSNFDDMSIEQIGGILKGATSISSEVNVIASNILGRLYYRKATYFHEGMLLTQAMENYLKAMEYNKELYAQIRSRLKILAYDFIGKASNLSNSSDNQLMLNYLERAVSLNPSLNRDLEIIISKIKNQINDSKDVIVKDIAQDIINQNKTKFDNEIINLVKFGMTSNEVIFKIGSPDSITDVENINMDTVIWSYDTLNKKLVFKNNILVEIQ